MRPFDKGRPESEVARRSRNRTKLSFRSWDLALDSNGNVFIADINNNRIRRIDKASGIIATIRDDAGSGKIFADAYGGLMRE